MADKPTRKDQQLEKGLQMEDPYHYNDKDDKYVTFLKKAAKQIVVNGDMHRAMRMAYCGEDGRSAEEICRSNDFPLHLFDEYKRIHGWTQKGFPLTDETVLNEPIEDSVQTLLNQRKFEILQETEKRTWRATEEQAQNWRDFQHGILDPFEKVLKDWKPPLAKPPRKKAAAKGSNAWFVVGFSDWQIGASAGERYMFRQKEWNTKEAHGAIDRLVEEIIQDLSDFNYKFEGCCLMLAGDMFHGLKALTEKGTKLECDLLRDDQVDALLNLLTYAIKKLYSVFPKLQIHTVRGNHDGTDHYPIMKILKAQFENYDNLEMTVHSSRTASFRILNTLVLLDHGASDLYPSQVPKSGKPKESYVQSLLLAHPEDLIGVNQRIFFQGDKHHYVQEEFADFEFVMLGALPMGDQYSDNMNLAARPMQNCLVITDKGTKSTRHYYIE